ncbi:hypothetical protein [Burkholderia sp. BCC0097]|uniref:hypothetical protein n=1 Tax=Burkholderia sp. BCC0097 TaxID=2676289 RepID=UPI001FC7D654|nr:hypothetical protein [Burkholderia sp. BCC0097]
MIQSHALFTAPTSQSNTGFRGANAAPSVASTPLKIGASYAQQESSEKLRKSTREKIAAALGITDAQLDV